MVSLGKFFGRTISEAAGFGIGESLKKPIEPVLQELTNETWRASVAAGVNVPLDPGDAADIVAEDVELEDWGADQAAQTGIGSDQFDALVRAALNSPGVSELLTLLRRNTDFDAHFSHGLRKNKLEPVWDPFLKALVDNLLTPQQIALGMVRSVIDDQGLLTVKLDISDSNVPQYTVYPGDGIKEAGEGGINPDRLKAMVGSIGLPLGAIAAAQAHFRGILTLGAFNQAILQGDTRPEWAPFILDYARQIPTVHDFIENRLRNYLTTDQAMYDGTARHGMTPADTDLIFQATGRPLAPHQVFIGLRRGGSLGGPIDDIDSAFLDALRKSNIRPEYYNLAWAQRETLPAVFVVRQMLKDGFDPVLATDILLEEGWRESLIAPFITLYGPTPSTTGSTHAKSASTSAVTAIKKAYTGGTLPPDQATALLARAGETQANAAQILEQWNIIAEIDGVSIDTAGATPH